MANFGEKTSLKFINSNYYNQRNKMYNTILSKNAMAWCAKNVQSFPKQPL